MIVEEEMDVEERLNAHSERLNKHDERLNQHSQQIQKLQEYDKEKHERLRIVERIDEEHERRLQEVEKNYSKLESTIVRENKETQLFFQSQMDKQWDLIKSRDEQRHDSRKMDHELKKTKVERWSEIIFKLALPGSILYLLFENYMR